MSNRNSKYSPEFRNRAVRMLLEHRDEHSSEWAAMQAIAGKLGCTGETLRKWVRQSENSHHSDTALTSKDRDRLKMLERENLELRRANEILRKASAYFAPPLSDTLYRLPGKGRNSTADPGDDPFY